MNEHEEVAVGVRFGMINNAVRRYVDHTSKVKKELDNMTCSNGWIIGHLCRMEKQGKFVYQRDFENHFGITRSTASKVLKLLEKKGVIERVPVSHDARMKKIILTEKSRRIGLEMDKEFQETEEQLTRGFTPEELKNLHDYLDRIEKNLELNENRKESIT